MYSTRPRFLPVSKPETNEIHISRRCMVILVLFDCTYRCKQVIPIVKFFLGFYLKQRRTCNSTQYRFFWKDFSQVFSKGTSLPNWKQYRFASHCTTCIHAKIYFPVILMTSISYFKIDKFQTIKFLFLMNEVQYSVIS